MSIHVMLPCNVWFWQVYLSLTKKWPAHDIDAWIVTSHYIYVCILNSQNSLESLTDDTLRDISGDIYWLVWFKWRNRWCIWSSAWYNSMIWRYNSSHVNIMYHIIFSIMIDWWNEKEKKVHCLKCWEKSMLAIL